MVSVNNLNMLLNRSWQ